MHGPNGNAQVVIETTGQALSHVSEFQTTLAMWAEFGSRDVAYLIWSHDRHFDVVLNIKMAEIDFVKKFLPESDLHIIQVDVNDVDDDESRFSVILRLKIQSKVEFEAWLKEHERWSAYTYRRILSTKPRDGKYVVFKVC